MLVTKDELLANLNERQRQLLQGRSVDELSLLERMDLHNFQGCPLTSYQEGDFKLDTAKTRTLDAERKLEAANAEILINQMRLRLRGCEAAMKTSNGSDKFLLEREIDTKRRELDEIWNEWRDFGSVIPYSEIQH